MFLEEEAINFYRTYKIKCYLNARHYILINNKKGEVHPHTWEFMLEIKIIKKDFIEFGLFEKKIVEFLKKYQNQVMNDIEPFDYILPTIENITDTFANDFYQIIKDIGGILVKLEGSETPTRMYTVDIDTIDKFKNIDVDMKKEATSNAIDLFLDSILM